MVRKHGKTALTSHKAAAVDIFCGAGGLTRGLKDAGINVVAGYDNDGRCKFPYEHNNRGAKFFEEDVARVTGESLAQHYQQGSRRILVGCAPCTPFTKYTWGDEGKGGARWGLLREFGRLIQELQPDVVSMENVPQLRDHVVFDEFLETLRAEGFHLGSDAANWEVYCPDYGMPQRRSRLVILASRLGPIQLEPSKCLRNNRPNVRSALSKLPELGAGDVCAADPLHRSATLTDINLRRIRASTAGGCWRDWPDELIATCHRKKKGKTYPSVYGRMSWDDPSPTITTQFFGFGNGRFGHPEQDRALSLREGAILQTFPHSYQFVPPDGKYQLKTIGRMIGNAVPVRLGTVIGKTIRKHLEKYAT